METRYHSPYRHWMRGLVSEIVVLGTVIVMLGLMGAFVSWLR